MDTIADMLIRIKNAQAVGHQTVIMPFSKLKHNLAKVLEREDLIKEADIQGRKDNKIIKIKLKYRKGIPAINNLKRISKPGKRVYRKKGEIKPIRQGYGLSVISTSQGLMTDKEARKKGLGGEVLCEVF